MANTNYAPIALFVYCRVDHAQRTVKALLANTEAVQSELFIFSDAPKNENAVIGVQATRNYIRTITGFKSITIVERKENWGLAKSLISGITEIVNRYGRVIVVEDDILVSPFFLKYMNDGLNMYADNPRVASIHAYRYPSFLKLPQTFFIKGADCWGWATWKRAWDIFNPDADYLLQQIEARRLKQSFNFGNTYPYVQMLKNQRDKKISSWAICWNASAFLNDMYTLYPGVSMAQQIGMDGIGATHSQVTDLYKVSVNPNAIDLKEIEPKQSLIGDLSFRLFFIRRLVVLYAKVIFRRLKEIFNGSK